MSLLRCMNWWACSVVIVFVAAMVLVGASSEVQGSLQEVARVEAGGNSGQNEFLEAGARREVRFFIDSNVMEENGRERGIDAAPYIEAGRTFIPARYLSEGLGAEAEHSPAEGPVSCVFLMSDDITVFISIGDYFVTVHENNGNRSMVFLEAPSRIVDGRTYLPFRAVAEAFGADVDFGPADGPVEWVFFRDS